jgi:hypothetical protein
MKALNVKLKVILANSQEIMLQKDLQEINLEI